MRVGMVCIGFVPWVDEVFITLSKVSIPQYSMKSKSPGINMSLKSKADCGFMRCSFGLLCVSLTRQIYSLMETRLLNQLNIPSSMVYLYCCYGKFNKVIRINKCRHKHVLTLIQT